MYDVDAYVISVVNHLLGDPDALRVFLGADQDPDVERMSRQLANLANDLDAAELELGNDEISARAFTIIERRIEIERTRLLAAVETKGDQQSAFDEVMRLGLTTLDGQPFDKQRSIIHSVCKVVVRPTDRRGKGFDRSTVDVLKPG